MSSTPDKVFAQLKNAKGVGDVTKALTQDPYLFIGIVSLIGLVYLFGRIYLWPWINPFQFKWFSNLWDWITSPLPPTPEESYPFAKVIYPTYR
jgi:hypothetical protein